MNSSICLKRYAGITMKTADVDTSAVFMIYRSLPAAHAASKLNATTGLSVCTQ